MCFIKKTYCLFILWLWVCFCFTSTLNAQGIFGPQTIAMLDFLSYPEPIQRHLKRYPEATIHERGYHHITFDNHDGTFTMLNITGHMHYKDSQTDTFSKVDTRVSFNAETNSWQQATASYKSDFPEYADQWMTFHDMFEGRNQAMRLKPKARHVRGRIDDPDALGEQAVVYKNAFGDGIDLQLFANNETMQKLVVIQNAVAIEKMGDAIHFDFAIDFPEGLLAIESVDGSRQWISAEELDGRLFRTERLLMGGSSIDANDFTYLKRFRIWDKEADHVDFIDVQFYREGAQWYFRKILDKNFFKDATFPIYTDASSSFFAGTGDGYIFYFVSGHTWSQTQDTLDGTSALPTANPSRILAAEYNSGLSQYEIRRAFFPFDTSALNDSVSIQSATVDLYLTTVTNGDNDGNDYVAIVQTNQADATTLAIGDYDECGDAVDNPTEGSDQVDLSSMSTSAYQTWTLNATGRGWVSTTGWTLLGAREGHDMLDDTIADDTTNQLRFSAAENTGTSQDPFLTVTYTLDISGTSDLADATEVAVAINNVIQTSTTTSVNSGSWTIASGTVPNTGDVVTVWASGVTDANEATGVTRYDGTGTISGMVLDTHVLSIGSADNQTLTGSMLGLYDNDDDEDIMYALNNSSQGLIVDADDVYTDDELDILSGETLTLTGTALSTHDLTINGTLTVSGTIDVDGSWLNNSGNFTHSSGTVQFLATSGTETITSGGDAFNNLLANDGGGTATWTLADAMDVNGTLRLQGGTLDVSANDYGVNVGSHWDNEDTFTSRSGTVMLDGTSGTINLTSGGSSFYNLLINDGGGSATFELQDALDVDGTLRIAGGTLDVKSGSDFSITVGGHWDNDDTFTAQNGQVTFDGTSTGLTLTGSMADTSAFYTVDFNGSNGEWTIGGSMTASAANAADTFDVSAGTVIFGDGGSENLEIHGRMTIASGAEFRTNQSLTQVSGTIIMDINDNNNGSPPSCVNCFVSISGTMDIGPNTVLRLNPDSSATDAYLQVAAASGYLEIQGTLNVSGSLTAVDTVGDTETTLCTDQTFTDDEHNGKDVRISAWGNLAFGRIYSIVDTIADDTNCATNTDDSLIIADVSTATDTNPNVSSGAACSGNDACTVQVAEALVTSDDDHSGRYLHNLTDDQYYLIIATDENSTDTVTILNNKPDAFTGMDDGDDVEVSDGIRAGASFEIYDYAHVTAENGITCDATYNESGDAYIYVQVGSALIKNAFLCNMGRSAFLKQSVTVDVGDFSLTNSWVQSSFVGANLRGGSNSVIQDNLIENVRNSGIDNAGTNNTLVYRNRIRSIVGSSRTAVYMRSGRGLRMIENIVHESFYPTRQGIGALIQSNQAYDVNVGFYMSGSSGSNKSTLYINNEVYDGNQFYISTNPSGDGAIDIFLMGNRGQFFSAEGFEIDGAQRVFSFKNQIDEASVGYRLQGSTLANASIISVQDQFGVLSANSSDINMSGTLAHQIRLYGSQLASSTEVNNVDDSDQYVISFNHDNTNATTRIWGEYSIPSDVAETPQNEGVLQLNYTDASWPDSFTQHGFSGGGTEDTDIDLAFTAAMGGTEDAYVYRVVCLDDATADCDGADPTDGWTVYRYDATNGEVNVGTVSKDETFTDGTTNVQFKIEGNSYSDGAVYIFAAWKASTDTNAQKTATLMTDGDTFTVGATETLEIKGASGNETTIQGTTGVAYSLTMHGTLDASYYTITNTDANGLNITGTLGNTPTITNLDNGTFDDTGGSSGSDTYLTVAGTVIDATGAQTWTDLTFDTGGVDGNVESNVTLSGDPSACANNWSFYPNAGNITGETNDVDGGDLGACNSGLGYLLWSALTSISGTSDLSDATVVALAINSTREASTTTTVSSGTWSFATATSLNANDVITVWADGVTDANEATGVTQYDGSGDITGMVLDTHVLSIGSVDNQTLTGTMLGLYDNDDDEDIMYALNNSAQGLLVDADNVYSDDELDVLSGDTLTLTGTALSTHDMTINGTLTVSGTIDVDGSWLNSSGNFTHSAGTVRFLATSGSETITSNADAFNNFLANDGGGTATWTLSDALDVDGTLRIQDGTLDVSASDYEIKVGSQWDNDDTFTARSGTVVLNGSNQTISGTTNFYNLVKTETTSRTLTFEASATTTISGTMKLKGAAGQLLQLRSSTPGTQALLDPQGIRDIQYLDVQDSYSTNATAIDATDGTHTNSGNNVMWRFQSRLLSPVITVD